jgi:hypothetical protein
MHSKSWKSAVELDRSVRLRSSCGVQQPHTHPFGQFLHIRNAAVLLLEHAFARDKTVRIAAFFEEHRARGGVSRKILEQTFVKQSLICLMLCQCFEAQRLPLIRTVGPKTLSGANDCRSILTSSRLEKETRRTCFLCPRVPFLHCMSPLDDRPFEQT